MILEDDGRLFAALVELADIAGAGFDVLELADSLVMACVELLSIDDAGIMLDDQRGSLRVLASTSEGTRLLELLELQHDEGPCLEAFRTGELISVVDLTAHEQSWPLFVSEALRQGIATTYAVPMKLRDRTVGALNIFRHEAGPLAEAELQVAQVMASMATIGIINHWTIRRQEVLAEQLQNALNSRVVVEQAKGVIAERRNVDMGEAFELLRSAARSARRPMSELASEIVLRRGTDILEFPGAELTSPRIGNRPSLPDAGSS